MPGAPPLSILINFSKKEKSTPTILQTHPSFRNIFPEQEELVNDLAELSVAAPIDVFSLTSLSGNGAGSIIQLSSSASLRLYVYIYILVCIYVHPYVYKRFFAEGCACMALLCCTHVSHRVIYHRV